MCIHVTIFLETRSSLLLLPPSASDCGYTVQLKQPTRWGQFPTENFQNRQKITVGAHTKGVRQCLCETRAVTKSTWCVLCQTAEKFYLLTGQQLFSECISSPSLCVCPLCPLHPFFFPRKLIIWSSHTSALAEPSAMCVVMMNHKL